MVVMVVAFTAIVAWRVLYLRRKRRRMIYEMKTPVLHSPRFKMNSDSNYDHDGDDAILHPEDAALLPEGASEPKF